MKYNFGNCRLSRGLSRLTNREIRHAIGDEIEGEKGKWELQYSSRKDYNSIAIFIAAILITGFLLWFKSF